MQLTFYFKMKVFLPKLTNYVKVDSNFQGYDNSCNLGYVKIMEANACKKHTPPSRGFAEE